MMLKRKFCEGKTIPEDLLRGKFENQPLSAKPGYKVIPPSIKMVVPVI
jgi:hypothetical protein